MKVLDLRCSQGHGFEGWFASEDDYQQQSASGLLSCPMCGDSSITKLLSSPRLNLRTGSSKGSSQDRSDEQPCSTGGESGGGGNEGQRPEGDGSLTPNQVQAAWLRMVRRVIEQTEDVGERFAQEARRIHYGEIPERAIRGKTSPQETEALLAEGITVVPLPIPEGMDGPLQ